MKTLGAFLDACAARAPGRVAIAYAPRERVTATMTWAELRAASRVAAATLVAAGVTRGMHVALLCPSRLEWLPLAFGVLRIGAVLVPMSTLWKRDELAYGLAHGDVATLVMVPRFLKHDYLAQLRELAPELDTAAPGRLFAARLPQLRRVMLLEGAAPGTDRWADLPATADEAFLDALEATVGPAERATIFFTSGTTAQAKAVVHCHEALVTSGERIAECVGIGLDDAWWGHMPLFWSGGFIIGALATMAGGGRLVLQETVDAGAALELLETERCTIMAGWHQAGPLLEHPDFARRRLFLRKGSNHVLAPRLLGDDHLAVGMYGMSETATCISCARWDDPPAVRRETFGRPLAGMEVRIVDAETRQPVAPGESGEILVKGPTLMEGYYKVPPADTFDAEGFFRTGDLGYLDAQGFLHFATRAKDVIKTAGVNVAAVEVEEALARHPAVKSAHVVGVPHATRGENVVAFVVPRPGASAPPDALQAFCRETLASYKVPRHVFVIAEAELPLTASGRAEKGALRKRAQAALGEQ